MKVTIIGTGQQGTSIAQALLKAEIYEISAYDANEDIRNRFESVVLNYAYEAYASNDHDVDIHVDPVLAVENADIIILATPIDKFGTILKELGNHIKPCAIVTDIGSSKASAIAAITAACPDHVTYIPAHPIAGSAGVGPETASPDMYENEIIAVIPQEKGTLPQQMIIEKMWRDMGGKIAHMDASSHDRLYGTISHFQRALAFVLTATGEEGRGHACPDYAHASNAMLDTTRIAKASVEMWLPIFKFNKKAILEAAEGFREQLDSLMRDLILSDSEGFQAKINEAHEFRASILHDRPRESLTAEGYDLFDEMTSGSDFNKHAVASAFARRTCLPTLIAAAATLNAKVVEQKISGVSIAKLANPSFKDGSAPMLSHPLFLTMMLEANQQDVLEVLNTFLDEYDQLMWAIEREDEPALRAYIERVSSIRSEMPPHRTAEKLRPEYIRESADNKLVVS